MLADRSYTHTGIVAGRPSYAASPRLLTWYRCARPHIFASPAP